MAKDIPEVFEGIVEVDETYLGGQRRNKRKEIRLKLGQCRCGFRAVKQPVFGILCREGKVYAEIASGIEAKDLEPLIEKQVKKNSTICSDGWRAYTGLVAKGYVHRIVDHSQERMFSKERTSYQELGRFLGISQKKVSSQRWN